MTHPLASSLVSGVNFSPIKSDLVLPEQGQCLWLGGLFTAQGHLAQVSNEG